MKSVQTLVLKTTLENVRSVTGSHVFPWTGNNCRFINATFYEQNSDDRFSLRHTCREVLNETLQPQNITSDIVMDPLYEELEGEPERNEVPGNLLTPSANRSAVFLTHIHVATHGIITDFGLVFLNDVKLETKGCPYQEFGYSADIHDSDLRQFPLHDEVFVASQMWNGYFHILVEQLVRMIPYLCFLRDHPSIKIHMNIRPDMFASAKEHLDRLGLNGTRLITGFVRAKLLYVPGGTACGDPPLFQARLLSLWLRHTMENAADLRTSVVLIHRKKGWRRWFKHHEDIKMKVSDLTRKNHRLVMEELTDPVPPLPMVAQMFNRATMIVALHGAGLSNMLFSEPGTVVVEAMCRVTPTGLCFRNLALALGHRYHGILTKKSCLNTSVSDLMQPVVFYMNLTSENKPVKNIIVHHPVQWVHLGH